MSHTDNIDISATPSLEDLIYNTIQQELKNFLKRRLLFWVLRWSILSSLVYFIVFPYINSSWVLLGTLIIAITSFVKAIVTNIKVIKKGKLAICFHDVLEEAE
ncbi:MAG: hypothetical protein AAF228_12010 [Pseudomonadota bacterium]